jgi:VWFA-related protein
MRIWLPVAAAAGLVAVMPVTAESPASGAEYHVDIEKIYNPPQHEGQKGVWVTVQFRIKRRDGSPAADLTPDHLIVIKEDHVKVAQVKPHQPKAPEDLTAVLALDISGSMKDHGKMEQARQAALRFLGQLHDNANCGVILFDHQIHEDERIPPTRDPGAVLQHREKLHSLILSRTRPRGGTAYLDATAEAVDMLQSFRGRRAVVVLTDGVDLNSNQTLGEVIKLAQTTEVPVYTLGVGDPGRNERVSTVLVLDRSGSMSAKADPKDQASKMEALHAAAARFVELMRPSARTTLLPFSDRPEAAGAFRADKATLRRNIQALRPDGQTALFDATHDAIDTLLAERPEGKKAVVALTDGIDNRSVRYRVEHVIKHARDHQVPLYMLGLGKGKDIDEKVMRRMAEETGGKYYHATDQQKLFDIFESLSIELHDDGIDEASLKRLAQETGGKYFSARDVSRLDLIFSELADELQTAYTVTFPSRRPSHDGTARGIKIELLRKGGIVGAGGDDSHGGADGGYVIVGEGESSYQVHGVVVPEMRAGVYLALLVVLGGLLALPSGLRRLARSYATR